MEPLLATYQDAMSCVQGLSKWLAEVYLSDTRINCMENPGDIVASEQMLEERKAFGRVLSLLASLASSHTVDLRPGVINVVYKSLIKLLEIAGSLRPSPGFWTAAFDGKCLPISMLHIIETCMGELFLLSPGAPHPPLVFLLKTRAPAPTK